MNLFRKKSERHLTRLLHWFFLAALTNDKLSLLGRVKNMNVHEWGAADRVCNKSTNSRSF